MAHNCPYTLDTVSCAWEFGHDGDHHGTSGGRDFRWVYEDWQREEDREVGYPVCGHQWVDKGLGCFRQLGHDGDHASAVGGWSWSDSVNDPPEPEVTEKPAPPVSPGVQAALDARKADRNLRKVAVRLEGGSVARYDVVAERIFDSGMLSLETTEGDITYAPGAWRSIIAEPVPREDD